MLVVLAVSFSACALAGTQAYNFNLRAVSSGLTGFRGSKNDDEARFYVTQTSATPESAYPNATWEKTLYRATWLDSGAVASNTIDTYVEYQQQCELHRYRRHRRFV